MFIATAYTGITSLVYPVESRSTVMRKLWKEKLVITGFQIDFGRRLKAKLGVGWS